MTETTKTPVRIADLFATTAELELLHPVTNEPLGVKLKLVGKDSTQFREAQKKIVRMKATEAKTKKEIDIDDAMTASFETVASFIVGWSDDEAMGGAYSPEYAMKLIENPSATWLREQVEAFALERANFFRPATA